MDQASRARTSRPVGLSPPEAGRPGLLLLLAALVPVLFFVVAQTAVIFGEAREEAERSAMTRARAISDQIDGEILADLRALKAVAQSLNGVPIVRNRPAPGRIAYNAELFPQWAGALVWALDAPPLSPAVFSSLPSEEIPVIPAHWMESLARQGQVVGGIERVGEVVAPVIHLPVPRDSRNLALTLVLRPDAFQSVLMAGLPADTVGAVVDRDGLFIARSLGIGERLGTPATVFVRDAIASGRSGIYRGRTYEGFENYTAYVTSDLTGWSVHLAISPSLIEGPRSRSLAVAIVGGLLCLAVLAGLAMLIAADMKRRRQAAEARSQAQKLETLGRLTGGVAHDFNNLLTVIVGNLEKLRRTLPAADAHPDIAAAISSALDASDRAAKLTRSMLAYSRQQALDLRVVPVNEIVSGFAHIADRTLGEDVRLEVDLDPDAGMIEIDDTQLGSAILNLAVNARDAMPGGGQIRMSTRRVNISRDDRALRLKPGEYAKVTVRDNGPGMDASTAARVFEPFFTTKPVGKGTGLGLSQVEGFVRQSGGAVDLETAPGAGTSVHLYLPLTTKTPAAAREAAGMDAPADARKLSILVVEDEEGVRASAVDLLTHMGHGVRACPTADAGLIAMDAGRYDLLFTDVVLPGELNGVELAERARVRQPGIGVILTTGYAGDALNMTTDGFVLLPKPYGEAELGAKLREAMRQAAGDARGHGRPASGRPERILLVEDEALIAMVATDILGDAGYEVVDAPNARMALAALSEGEQPFDAAIIDLGLPDMNGSDLIAAIRADHPGLPVIIASGRGALLDAEGGAPEAACVVDKPYTAEDLVGAVRRVLGAD